ncbi:MAG: VTT domain-containing protein [Chloroflexota bacterium]
MRERLVPILMLALVIAITVGLFLFRNQVAQLGNYGYLGAFLISLVANATVILPIPGILALVALGTTLNPFLVALAGSTGGAVGEITGFVAGYGGRGIARDNRMYLWMERRMKRWSGWLVFLFALLPFAPLDIAGVVAGVLGYPLWKFLTIVWVGKSIKYIILVWAGVLGWQSILRFFGY